jgi:hypothetical protein
MIAIFKSQIAVVDAAIQTISASGAQLPSFDPDEVEDSDDSIAALTSVMTEHEANAVLEDLFVGPEEVQAIAFLSLVALRLLRTTTPAEANELEPHDESVS